MNSLKNILFLNEPKLICLHKIKLFQVLLSNTNNSIQYYSFNGSKYCYVILIIQFNISHFHCLILQIYFCPFQIAMSPSSFYHPEWWWILWDGQVQFWACWPEAGGEDDHQLQYKHCQFADTLQWPVVQLGTLVCSLPHSPTISRVCQHWIPECTLCLQEGQISSHPPPK